MVPEATRPKCKITRKKCFLTRIFCRGRCALCIMTRENRCQIRRSCPEFRMRGPGSRKLCQQIRVLISGLIATP